MTTERHRFVALRPGSAGFESRRLGIGGVAQLLGVPRLTAWWWVRTDKLPVMNTAAEAPWWTPAQVYRWALAHPRLRLSGRVPLRHWPSAADAADYLGAADLDEAIATQWRTPAGIVSVLWPLADGRQRSLKAWAAGVAPRGDGAVILVTNMFSAGQTSMVFCPASPTTANIPPYGQIWLAFWARPCRIGRQRCVSQT